MLSTKKSSNEFHKESYWTTGVSVLSLVIGLTLFGTGLLDIIYEAAFP
jgi:hypothetical protein